MEIEPLFQLNLFLWLNMAQPSTNINPVFYRAGFKIYSIGPTLTPEDGIQSLAKQANLNFNGSVDPDLFLQNTELKLLAPLELKKSSFSAEPGTATSTSKIAQANTLLSISGPNLATLYGFSNEKSWNYEVLYCVTDGKEDLMQKTLINLSKTLEENKIKPALSSVFGVLHNSDGIHLTLGQEACCSNEVLPVLRSCTGLVIEAEPEVNIRPLYLIPYDSTLHPIGEEKTYQLKVMEQRIRTGFVSLVASRARKLSFTITVDELLEEALGIFGINIWNLWKDRKTASELRSMARSYIMKEAAAIMKRFDVRIIRKGNTSIYEFSGFTRTKVKEFRKYLGSAPFRQGTFDMVTGAIQSSMFNEEV